MNNYSFKPKFKNKLLRKKKLRKRQIKLEQFIDVEV